MNVSNQIGWMPPFLFDDSLMFDEFSTAIVDNFVDYWRRCRRDQPGIRIPANRLGKQQRKMLVIAGFCKHRFLGIRTG